MSKLLFIAPVSLLVMAACSTETASTEASAPEADTAPAEAVIEAAAPETEAPVEEAGLCEGFGPQTPRDISLTSGTNSVMFDLAPPATELNLCNIHTHTQAEHKAPGFSVFAGPGPSGGFQCNETADLTEAELVAAPGAYEGVVPGDTIEVHWVHSSCPIQPGEGLGSCLSDGCDNPFLRVEAQSFLVVNDADALDFMDFAATVQTDAGLWQASAIPSDTGEPILFRGSTTGPSYDQATCSPLQVTWNVRPMCAKLDINSLHRWAESGNVFNETKSHGVRALVTAPELLSAIE